MMKLLRIRLGARLARVVGARDDERGMALATVIIFGTVLLMMSATIVGVSVSGNTRSQKDSNWVAAGQAAYAGVEDYQSKLANDNSYAQYGTLASPFSVGSTFTGVNGNAAFTTGTSTVWQPVDPSQKPGTDPSYRYAVNNSQYSITGALSLQVTGRVNGTTRTVVANLKQSGFLDYLYFTDLEFTDPAIDTDCPTKSTYQWAATLSTNCNVIQFASGDTISGPAHSNDRLTICGSHFLNTLSTSDPAASATTSKGYTIPSGCSQNATIDKGGKATYSPVIQMPATITSLIQETRSDLKGTTVPRPGCLYTGPTTFTFNADGTWTVYSPWTQVTNVTGSPVSGGNNDNSAQCGSPGYSGKGNTLGSPGGQTFKVVPNNLVYVQNVPSAAGDPNTPTSSSTSFSGGKFFTSSLLPQSYSCTGGDGKTAGDGVGYPASGETAPSSASYGCQNGDAFISGTVSGQVTIAANNYAYITDNIYYNDTSNDLLGIIGQNNVYVYNPVATVAVQVKCTNSGTVSATGSKTCTVNQTQLMDRTKSDLTIDAAIMSVAHSFTVENYSADGASTTYPTSPGYPKGKLNVLGSIVQKYRGPVATSAGNGVVGTGYTKNYLYDSRLAFEAPPKFLSPVSTSYGITSVTETKTAVNAQGVTP
jgi:hypothetical protein